MSNGNPNNAEWGVTEATRPLAKELDVLIPISGPVAQPNKNPKLEKYRKAANVVYDIFNNGLMNRGLQLRVLGLRKHDLPRIRGWGTWSQCEGVVEKAFTPIIIEACVEQGILNSKGMLNDE